MIQRVYVESSVRNTIPFLNFRKNQDNALEITEFEDFEELSGKLNLQFGYESGKKILVFKENKGKFLKQCPCTTGVQSCGYYILNIIQNCYIGCTYCYLQQYMNNNLILINSNIEKIEEEVKELIESGKENIRLGSGEFSDSLLFDAETGITAYIAEIINQHREITFEIKTKTIDVQHLMNMRLQAPDRIVFAWSVNPQKVIDTEEECSASLSERINAATIAIEKGYLTAFHFDPVIVYPNWELDYKDTIKGIFNSISQEKIAWISIGAFRSNHELLPLIRRKYPDSKILSGEFISGMDKKIRYIKPLRKKIFEILSGEIRKYTNQTVIYLCMEKKEMWAQSGCLPEKIIRWRPNN